MSSSIQEDFYKKLRQQTLELESQKKVNLYPFWPIRANFSDKIEAFWKITENYQLEHNWAVEQQLKIYSSLNILTNLAITNQIRRSFNLVRGNVAAFQTLAPVFIFSTSMGAAFHLGSITSKIISNPLDPPYSIMFQSALGHLTTSVVYPIIFTTGSALYFASKNNTFPIPDDILLSKESRKYIYDKIIKIMFRKYRKSWLWCAGLNVFAAAILTYFESLQTKQIFFSELNQYNQRKQQEQ